MVSITTNYLYPIPAQHDMFLRRLKIKNVRSYKEEEIFFPAGSVLLAGEIGAGKSTLLLAIEFALFGLRKSRLSGRSLLRHGAKEGFVELEFQVYDKPVVIHRRLRLQHEEIGQDTGFLIFDGKRMELTAIELKAKILELLGYPPSFLSKTKNLVFTYTVYTPQEEMKHILHDDPDNRLDILRKVFGMDKYKHVRENTFFVVKNIKERMAQYELLLQQQLQKQELLMQEKERLAHLARQVVQQKELYEHRLGEEKVTAQKIAFFEQQLSEQHVLHLQHVAVKERQTALQHSLVQMEKDFQLLSEHIQALQNTPLPILPHEEKREEITRRVNTQQLFVQQLANKKSILLERKEHLGKLDQTLQEQILYQQSLQQQLTQKQREYDTLLLFLQESGSLKETLLGVEQDVLTIGGKLKEVEVHLQHVRASMQQISVLSSCPTCLQEVGTHHKQDTLTKHSSLEQEFLQKQKQLLEKKAVLERTLASYREKEEMYAKKERQASLCKMELLHLDKSLAPLASVPEKMQLVHDELQKTEQELALVEKQDISGLYAALEGDKEKLIALDTYQEQILQYERQKQLLEEKKRQLHEITVKRQEVLLTVPALEREEKLISQKLASFASLDETYKKTKKEYEACHLSLRHAEVAWKTTEKEHETFIQLCLTLEKELAELAGYAEHVTKLKQLSFWLTEHFCNLMITLEKHLFVAIHRRFTELFAQWFSLLMDDESIAVQLDDMFTPIILQNGYEVPFDYLSGGERTSCALAYRLALNKVINDVQSIVTTRDIMILDEPTEGFSSDQLDRVRMVLDELHLAQLIIVSHESKVEGFVEHVLRVVKGENGSKVITG